MRRASREAWCEAPRPRFYPCPGGGRGAAPSARSTPTRAQRGTRPKSKIKHSLYYVCLSIIHLIAKKEKFANPTDRLPLLKISPPLVRHT
ncbi:MAG: hypothetical protein NZ455_11880 [Bacteroidia bacterium]|nr:hypothetical protein [Bacteroidia bacterium]MDW8348093.1 hypothetical protein [Bacteroidia bacterium]